MIGDSGNKKKKDESSGIAQKSYRGNMDEYEALRTIVAENPGLLMRILEKIRSSRTPDASQKTVPTSSNKDDKSKKA